MQCRTARDEWLEAQVDEFPEEWASPDHVEGSLTQAEIERYLDERAARLRENITRRMQHGSQSEVQSPEQAPPA